MGIEPSYTKAKLKVPVKNVNFRKNSSGKYLGAKRKAKESSLSGQI